MLGTVWSTGAGWTRAAKGAAAGRVIVEVAESGAVINCGHVLTAKGRTDTAISTGCPVRRGFEGVLPSWNQLPGGGRDNVRSDGGSERWVIADEGVAVADTDAQESEAILGNDSVVTRGVVPGAVFHVVEVTMVAEPERDGPDDGGDGEKDKQKTREHFCSLDGFEGGLFL